MRDYYYILGIDKNATNKEIKTAYRKLSMKFHPDKNNGEKFFEDRFKDIQEAYETLSDTNKKNLYDYNLGQFITNSETFQDDFKNYEQELKRKFEEELRKKEEEIKQNFQERERKIKKDFAEKIKSEPDKKIKKSNSYFVFYLLFTFILMISVFLLVKTKSPLSSKETTEKIVESDLSNIKSLVQEWNSAHLTKNRQLFSKLFAKSVLFYGEQYDNNACIEKKFSLFDKYPNFYQQIVGEIQVKIVNNNQLICNFLKRVTINQKTKDYPSYLTFQKSDTGWQIIVEGDLVTDYNLTKNKQKLVPYNAIKGDFDGDGLFEYVWIIPPKFSKDQNGDNDGACVGDCTSYLKFSNDKIPSIKLDNCIGGVPINEGDLNNNGSDEIGILKLWWTSCWRPFYVYTLINNKWELVVDPISTHCDQWDKGVIPIQKDVSKPGYVLINYSSRTEEGVVIHTESILAKK